VAFERKREAAVGGTSPHGLEPQASELLPSATATPRAVDDLAVALGFSRIRMDLKLATVVPNFCRVRACANP